MSACEPVARQSRIGRPLGRRRIVGRRDRPDACAGPPAAAEAAKIASANSAQLASPAPAMWKMPRSSGSSERDEVGRHRENTVGDVERARRIAALVGDDADLVALTRQAEAWS